LGNVRAVVGDNRESDGTDAQGNVRLRAALRSYANYYAFGLEMPNMNWRGSGYRYGFNGKEIDREFANNYDYGFRIYNPGIGRFLSVDPLTKGYPMLTPYQFASNSPIMGVDLDGKEFEWYLLEQAEKLILGTTRLKQVKEGFQERAIETVIGTALGIAQEVRNSFNEPPALLATIDPGIATRRIKYEVGKEIQKAQTVVNVVNEYVDLTKKAASGEPKAVGAVGFEAAMFFVPGDEARFTTKATGYRFEALGYKYSGKYRVARDGVIDIDHYLVQGGKDTWFGTSTINKDGELFHAFEVPELLRGKHASKAAYEAIENMFEPKSIRGSYSKGSDNYSEFMRVYDPAKNNWENALKATPAHKAMPEGYKVKGINLKNINRGIEVIYEKK
jgi:RHS repeat-associated protein